MTSKMTKASTKLSIECRDSRSSKQGSMLEEVVYSGQNIIFFV